MSLFSKPAQKCEAVPENLKLVPKSVKDKLLDAAEQIIIKGGLPKLTLAAVAADAGISKGGLLYHFPEKDALIKGMVERLCVTFDHLLKLEKEEDPNPYGSWTRAYIRTTLQVMYGQNPTFRKLSAAILAAAAHKPKLLKPLHLHAEQWRQTIQQEHLDPIFATLIRLTMDGLWLADLFGLPVPEKGELQKILTELEGMSTDRLRKPQSAA